MSPTLDAYHPRHYQSPLRFSVDDRALLLKTLSGVYLLVDAEVRIQADKPLDQAVIAHTLGAVDLSLPPLP